MLSEPSTVGDGTHLMFIAKNLERIGDHATNIAELVHYQITGQDLADRPKL
jgi:phosphate transport system protein